MVERFNRWISEALYARPQVRDNARFRTKFFSHKERQEFLLRFVQNYNHTRLRCLHYKTPVEGLTNLTEHNTMGGLRGIAWS